MERNRSIDFLKALCSFLVICIHAPVIGQVGEAMKSLSRVAVPLFFMVTGYYYTVIKEHSKQRKQLVKILRLFIGANLLYFAWCIFLAWYADESVIDFLGKFTDLELLLQFVLLNRSPLEPHLWYLGAILYVLLIVFLFEKRWSRKKLYPLIPILLLVNLMIGNYAPVFFGKALKTWYSRNFLFCGLPYFLLGDLIYTKKINIKPSKAAVLSLAFVCTTLLEFWIAKRFLFCETQDHYISTVFLSVCIFLLAAQHNSKCNRRWYRMLCDVGAVLSTDIYILHPIVLWLLPVCVEKLGQYLPLLYCYYYVQPCGVMICTTILAMVVYRLKKATRLALRQSKNT